VEVTTGLAKEIFTVDAAVTPEASSEFRLSVVPPSDARSTVGVDAFAAIPEVRTSPEAAAITAAWRPTPPTLELTAFEMTEIGLVLTTSARWRPRAVFEDKKDPLPKPAR
jgi:hypothetical protein